MSGHLSNLARQHYEEDRRPSYFVEPLTALHLSALTSASGAGFTGRWGYLYLFGVIALGILLIACVNYVNLATARASHRAGEVGVRKAVGASRPQLARQFLGESLLVTLCALALAVGLTEAALPAFNNFFGTHLDLAYTENLPFVGAVLALVGIVGPAAGSYPALVLSGFEPTRVLTEYGSDGRRGALLRKGLVITQFALSAVLLISTFVIYRQLDYLERKDLGFDEERVIVAELPGSRGWGLGDEPADRAWRLRGALRQDVLAHPGVADASVASGAPAQSLSSYVPGKPSEMSSAADVRDDQSFRYAQAVVDCAYGIDHSRGNACTSWLSHLVFLRPMKDVKT